MVISYIKEKKCFPDFDFFGGETRTARTGPTKFWRKVDASATGNDNNDDNGQSWRLRQAKNESDDDVGGHDNRDNNNS